MCTEREGKELMKIFSKYYEGSYVDEQDLRLLDTLFKTEYLECFIQDGKLYARAGPIGRLFHNPSAQLPA